MAPEDFETKEELYSAVFFYLQDALLYLVTTILSILLINQSFSKYNSLFVPPLLIILAFLVWYHLTGGWVTVAFKSLVTLCVSMVFCFAVLTYLRGIDFEVMLKAG